MVRDFQRVMSAVYRAPRESTIYADISVDAAVVEAFIEQERKAGRRVTLTALACLAAAHALRRVPEANVVWRRGAFRRRQEVSTWIYSTTPQGDVTGGLMTHGDGGLVAIQKRVDGLSVRKDPERGRPGRGLYAILARRGPRTLRTLVWATAAWLHDFGGRVRWLGLTGAGLGAMGITNVGSIGITTAPAIPLPPFARHVALISVASVHDHAWVRNGQVVAGRRLPMTASLDHRAFVGLFAGRLMVAFQEVLTDAALLERLARGEHP